MMSTTLKFIIAGVIGDDVIIDGVGDGGSTHSFPCAASATVMLLLWATQANWSPLGEKETLCTHPPQSLCSSITSPKGILAPQAVGPGFSSMSLM